MFSQPKVERPDPPPNAPTEARPSIFAAGQRATAAYRASRKDPAMSLIGASTGSGSGIMDRKGSTRKRSLIGGVE